MIALLLGAASCMPAPLANFPYDGPLPIQAVGTVLAGESLLVDVGPVSTVDGTPVMLLIVGTAGPIAYQGRVSGEWARFAIDGKDTRAAGTTTLIASLGIVQSRKTVEVRPGEPLDPIVPLVGPRTLAAGTGKTMVTIIPSDYYGNLLKDGTPVLTHALLPEGTMLELRGAIDGGVASQWIPTGARAGRGSVVVNIADSHGPEASFTVASAEPETFNLTVSPLEALADGQTVIVARTSVIRDRYANIVGDGTTVTFIFTGEKGRLRTVASQTIAGVAEAMLQAPMAPGRWTASATVFAVASEPVSITFTAHLAVGGIALRASLSSESIFLEAGPILGQRGEIVPDWTRVQFRVTASDEVLLDLSATTVTGRAVIELRRAALPVGYYKAEAQAGAGSGVTEFMVE